MVSPVNILNWYPLRNFTHYSLLKGFSKPSELAKICADNDYPACGIADYKTISGCVSFYQACKKAGIKPLLGCSFDTNTVFARNKNGWCDLIEMVSSLDEEGNVNTKFCQEIMSRDNLISISKDVQPSYYTDSKQAGLHRVLLCSALKTTLPKIQKQLRKNELDANVSQYFTNDDKCVQPVAITKEMQHIYEVWFLANECRFWHP